MGLLVILTVWLRQKGSSESAQLDHDDEEEGDRPEDHRNDPGAPWPVRRGGWVLRLYGHSLGIALLSLFVASFVLHGIGSHGAECAEQQHQDQGCENVPAAFTGARFWFESFQNWQSEFLSVGTLLVLSIYLRERGSPQSKPVHAPHAQTSGE